MQFTESLQSAPKHEDDVAVYEAPAIIYEGTIGTRAGTSNPAPDFPDDDLFGD